MIKKSIFIFFILFIAYTIFIIANKQLSASHNNWQDNIVKAQNYIYDESDTINNVIIGSSLSCHIIMDSLDDFFDLSFAGRSIINGLNVIKYKKKLPGNIYIEMNFALRGESIEFNKALYAPIPFTIKKYVVSLRDSKQPVSLLAKYFMPQKMDWFINSIRRITDCIAFKIMREKYITNELKRENDEKNINNEILKKLLKVQIESYNLTPSNNLLYKQFSLLSKYVEYLKKNNVNVCFYEMPVNPELINLPFAKTTRNEFYKIFPKEKYNYIELPDCSDYVTTDGVHLTQSEAAKYTSYLKRNIMLLEKQ